LSSERSARCRCAASIAPAIAYVCGDDGSIEFLGRRDGQVKIRGHRIELGEIESALARLPEIKASAVAMSGDSSESRRLVAYCVAADRGPPPTTVLRDLRSHLPEYMVPSGIVWAPALPLNASGKLDRRALAALGEPAKPRHAGHVAPRDMFEQLLARIWEDLLGVKEVGVLDHFFEIGGHSLLAAKLHDAIERETGLTAPLTALFADDTIVGLARALRDGAAGLEAPIVALNGSGTLPPFVFLHGDFTAGGFYSRALARALGAQQPTLIVHPHGLVDLAIPDTIEAMAADRIRALRALRPRGPYVIGGHCNGAFVAFEMARQLLDAGEQVPAIVLIEARAPRGGGVTGSGGEDLYVQFDASGSVRTMAARDRQSDAELRYSRAMGRYAGGRCSGHIVLLRSKAMADPERDLGWSRFGGSGEVHVLPGNHTSIITRYVGDVAKVVRGAIDRALERVMP
jgi:thioesterase domain-containing protein